MLSSDSASDDVAPNDLEYQEPSNGGREEIERFIRIKDDADLVLDIEMPSRDEHILYLVPTAHLRDSSLYFRSLLDPEKFSEGVRVSAVQRTLRDRYRAWEDVPPEELPRISITDIGLLSDRIRHEELMTAFLRILLDVHSPENKPTPTWLANLVVIADRFDGSNSVKLFVAKHHGLSTAMTARWLSLTYKEEPIRQILLSGMLLNIPQWVASCTTRLVKHGSRRWDAVAEGIGKESRGLWWTLPRGFEGASNACFSRKYYLETDVFRGADLPSRIYTRNSKQYTRLFPEGVYLETASMQAWI